MFVTFPVSKCGPYLCRGRENREMENAYIKNTKNLKCFMLPLKMKTFLHYLVKWIVRGGGYREMELVCGVCCT